MKRHEKHAKSLASLQIMDALRCHGGGPLAEHHAQGCEPQKALAHSQQEIRARDERPAALLPEELQGFLQAETPPVRPPNGLHGLVARALQVARAVAPERAAHALQPTVVPGDGVVLGKHFPKPRPHKGEMKH